jgi:NitT/TauT family transport system ATP-binding protein
MPSSPTPALDFTDVTVRFSPRSSNEQPYTAIANVNLKITAGEFVSIVGPTGCGKSTLLNVAAGLLKPSEGKVQVFGVPLDADRALNTQAGYMFQAESLMPWRTALANVTAGLDFAHLPRYEGNTKAREWLARVGLTGFENRYPHELSGGMRKRVSLAQMLIMNPKILLMDEPFSALDVQTRALMENELLQLWQADRKSVMFITHDLEEAIALSDRVVVLSAGPATRIIGEFPINLPRPGDVAEVCHTPRFIELHDQIWRVMKEEVLKGYAQTRNQLAGAGA